MTTCTAPTRGTQGRSRGIGRLTAPGAAGVAFVAAWATGLAVWPTNLDVAAPGACLDGSCFSPASAR
jgi:hypothetical protein